MPILFISTKNLEEDKIKGYQTGADDYITKPFKVDELQLSIQRALDHQHDKREIRNLRQIVKGFPGSRLFRRRGAEEIAAEAQAEEDGHRPSS